MAAERPPRGKARLSSATWTRPEQSVGGTAGRNLRFCYAVQAVFAMDTDTLVQACVKGLYLYLYLYLEQQQDFVVFTPKYRQL